MPAITYNSQSDDTWDVLGTFIHICEKTALSFWPVAGDVVVDLTEEKWELEIPFNNVRRSHSFTKPIDYGVRERLPVMKRGEANPYHLSEHDIDAAMHINSMLCNGIRNHATGVAVHGRKVTLYYGDRFGLVISTLFDLVENIRLLVRVIAAITNAHSMALGYAPFLQVPQTGQPVNLDGMTLSFPNTSDVCGNLKTRSYNIALEPYRPMWLPDTPVGRATTVVRVRPRRSGAAFGPSLIFKYSWVNVGQANEGEMTAEIHRKLSEYRPDVLDNIANMICWFNGTMEDASLPRVFFGDVTSSHPRLFSGIVMKRYTPLPELQSASAFRKKFLDVIRGHYYVWEYADALQGDISLNNVMFSYDGGEYTGVLCDFDLARRRESVEKDLAEEKIMRKRFLAGEVVKLPSLPMLAKSSARLTTCHASYKANIGFPFRPIAMTSSHSCISSWTS
ncbi:hypothetical protein BXZ70DRAFT_597993 [Cristinia sonorae]|uniref:Fungal-type protein kinase domain-containing protein n=1 Tax=Cristinia sonorae TaxID=1940300 RepID=A0A8K0UVE9_9AGAR|nr:hypothetical protein BXZ70DRAFT_597993 [Cristinia sonorae]